MGRTKSAAVTLCMQINHRMYSKKIFWSAASLVIALLLSQPGYSQIKDLMKKAENAAAKLQGQDPDLAAGLKEALNNGVGSAVESLSRDKGYFESPYKILIPEDACKVIDKVKLVPGFQDVETKLISQMNKAAELAADKAIPIFTDAIKGMSFRDAKAILSGPDNAATEYLQSTSRAKLYEAFLPAIQSSLDEVNARTYWTSVVEAYNRLPFVKKMNPALDDHVNNKALDGLFGLIAVKEKGIRHDVSQRTSDLLLKVFGRN